MQNAVNGARLRLNLSTSSLNPARHFVTKGKMHSPKIRNIAPLPSEEAKWTELRKIEVLIRVSSRRY
jgi:hypothetical protein